MLRDAMTYEQYEAEEDRRYRHRPICACCGERIRSEKAYDVDGLYCQDCFDEYVESISQYVED